MAGTTDLAPLTPRQREILMLIAEGLSCPQVAQRMAISVETVSRHVANIRGRLHVRTVAQATFMLGLGLIRTADRTAAQPPTPLRADVTPPAAVTDPHSKLYLRALDRWIASGFENQTARDLMDAIHGGDASGRPSMAGDIDVRRLLEETARETLAPTRRERRTGGCRPGSS